MPTHEESAKRVVELRRALEDDWVPGCPAPTFPADYYTGILLSDLNASGAPMPHVFPSINGGYHLEWDEGDLEIDIQNVERVEFFMAPLFDEGLTEYISQDFDHYPGYPDMVRWIRDCLDLPRVDYVRNLGDF